MTDDLSRRRARCAVPAALRFGILLLNRAGRGLDGLRRSRARLDTLSLRGIASVLADTLRSALRIGVLRRHLGSPFAGRLLLRRGRGGRGGRNLLSRRLRDGGSLPRGPQLPEGLSGGVLGRAQSFERLLRGPVS